MVPVTSLWKKSVPAWAVALIVLVLVGTFVPALILLPRYEGQRYFDELLDTIPARLAPGAKVTFFDWWYVEPGYHIRGNAVVDRFTPDNVSLSYFRPTVSAPILVADQPWESNFLGLYTTLLHDEGKYRLWYEGYPYWAEQRDSNAHFCYAESLDGFHWTKPRLNITGFNGTTGTNILFAPEMHPRGDGLHGATVFKDPHANASERYKLTYCGKADTGDSVVHGAVSPDGLHWTLLPDPLVVEHADSQTSVTWDETKQRYVGYFRHWEENRRHVSYAETTDFRHWPQPRHLFGAEGFLDPSEDYYTNGYARWPNATAAHLMFPTIYHRGATVAPGDHLDVSLGVSRNGLNWYFPLDAPFVPLGPAGSGREGMVFAGSGLVTLPNGSWALPLGCAPYTHNVDRGLGASDNSVHLAMMRPDGVAGVVANASAPGGTGSETGEFWTVPLAVDGSYLEINARTAPGGWVKVGVETEGGTAVWGLSINDATPLTGDLLWDRITWRGHQALGTLTGEVRLHVQLHDACLHAIRVV